MSLFDPPTSLHTSGNFNADRRYDYALALAGEGDVAAAADLLEQTIDLAPLWPALWLALGQMQDRLGQQTEAAASFARVMELDPQDRLGASLHLARLGAEVPATASPAHMAALFDQYAPRFDTHLTGTLGYRGPQLLWEAVGTVCSAQDRPLHFSHALDLGCGTGLAGVAFRACVDHLAGVDLSPAMIAQAKRKQVYDRLDVDALEAFLDQEPSGKADLVLAADVLVYVGDLAPVLAATARTLAPGGLFALTLQRGEGQQAYALGADLRFCHAPEPLRQQASQAGFEIVHWQEASTRRDAGHDVPGLVVVLARI